MLANLVTAVRIPAAFLIIPLLCMDWRHWNQEFTEHVGMILAFVVMIIAELSDWWDGLVARSRFGEVTQFGKVFDPICDSIYHQMVFLAFFLEGWMPWWPLLVIIPREVESYVYRWVMSGYGFELGARQSGKWKARTQAFAQFFTVGAYLIFPYLGMSPDMVSRLSFAAILLAVAVAFASGVDYACHGYRQVSRIG